MSNKLSLFCLVDGEATSRAFSVKIPPCDSIGELKKVIKAENPNTFNGIDAKNLTLWRVAIPDDGRTVSIDKDVPEDEKKELRATNKVSIFGANLPEDTIHVIVQRPSSEETLKRRFEHDPESVPLEKRVRLEQAWAPFTASDGNQVDLPESWTASEFVPEPRAAFAHLRNNLQPGDAITIPSLGQTPKEFGLHGQGQILFVTEQMLELWEDMCGDKDYTYRRVLSGPMGVGKSYLSYFLAARAYAEGWLVLYIEDAGVLKRFTEGLSTLEVVKRFLALNSDILTGAELRTLVDRYHGTMDISTHAADKIFMELLKSTSRKTLLLVDEHGKLFEEAPYVPDQFKSLGPLSRFDLWGENSGGTRLVLTGTAHAKYEMTILPDSYRQRSVVFVCPLSRHVFSKLLDTYPQLAALDIRDEVTEITNCVPRELVNLSSFMEDQQVPISKDNLQKWVDYRTSHYRQIATKYYENNSQLRNSQFYTALLSTFLGSTDSVAFDWDFVDLGLVYRTKSAIQPGIQYRILCLPAQKGLLALFKDLSLSDSIKKRICDGTLDGDDFEQALCHQLICATKPIVLNATDLNGMHPNTVTLDFSHCKTLRTGQVSLEFGLDKVLTRGYKGYPRFDFMLGPVFIQASISDFGSHNKDKSANLVNAFIVRDANGTNQIERYLNDVFGPGHSATIENFKFVVTKNGMLVPGFHIVYLRGSPGQPAHRTLVNRFPDLLHVSFEELKENFFKNIV